MYRTLLLSCFFLAGFSVYANYEHSPARCYPVINVENDDDIVEPLIWINNRQFPIRDSKRNRDYVLTVAANPHLNLCIAARDRLPHEDFSVFEVRAVVPAAVPVPGQAIMPLPAPRVPRPIIDK